MSEKAQINVRQGNKVLGRIFCNWGTPDVVLSALRTAATKAVDANIVLNIARLVKKELKGTGWETSILVEDYDPDALDYRYTVNVSSKPWRVRQTQMPSYGITRPNGSFDNSSASLRHRNPAVTTNLRIGGK